jgi:hypothetical protein
VDTRKSRYSVLGKIVEAIGEHAGPLVVSLIKSGLAALA